MRQARTGRLTTVSRAFLFRKGKIFLSDTLNRKLSESIPDSVTGRTKLGFLARPMMGEPLVPNAKKTEERL
ncbi:MAG: hypothetical protein ACRESZ_01870 [Methylococcales bacterium]